MNQADIIVIGAGAAGLMAALHLGRAGKKVTILEANNRIGGRIHTIPDEHAGFIELGAEFVHGDLPVTLALLDETVIGYRPAGGEMWHARGGRLTREGPFNKDWEVFEEKLVQLENDMTLDAFLEEYFSGDKYIELRNWARKYTAGYDTADPARASAFALRKEWIEDDEGAQHYPNGGYGKLLHWMANDIQANGGTIHTGTTAKEIQWEEGVVTVITAENEKYTAQKCITTIPLGVLQAGHDAQCGIRFSPALASHTAALQSMGMGNVIKILLVCKTVFWKDKQIVKNADGDMEHMMFMLSDEPIPTWWTQHPDDKPVLTGWLGGPNAAQLKNSSDEDILAIGKRSLAAIFDMTIAELEEQLLGGHAVNWPADPYALGSYSYATVVTAEVLQLLNQPIANTLYFAGEAYYTDTVMGTVEAALASGKQVAEGIITSSP